jgi:carbon-monoxide dehydrogenase large subunit
VIGAALRRVEDQRLLAGAGCFVGDIELPGTLHCAIVRSPHAHARILGIDNLMPVDIPAHSKHIDYSLARK